MPNPYRPGTLQHFEHAQRERQAAQDAARRARLAEARQRRGGPLAPLTSWRGPSVGPNASAGSARPDRPLRPPPPPVPPQESLRRLTASPSRTYSPPVLPPTRWSGPDANLQGPLAVTRPAAAPIVATVRAAPRKPDRTTYYQLGWEFLTGQGPREHRFRAGDPALEELRRAPSVQEMRTRVRETPSFYGHKRRADHSLSGLNGVPTYLQQYGAIPTGGLAGNLAEAYLGSYQGSYNVLSVSPEGRARVRFRATNDSTLASAMHPPYLGYTPWWRENVEPTIDAVGRNGLFGAGALAPKHQDFEWYEDIQLTPAEQSRYDEYNRARSK